MSQTGEREMGLYEDDSKENNEWIDRHWFYISNHSNCSTLPDGLQHIFARHEKDWGFTENDNWNNQNGEKLQRTLREFIHRKCVIIYRGEDKDYELWSGWKLSNDQYRCVTQPPFRLNAAVLIDDENIYSDEVYNQIGDFFGLDEIKPEDNYELDYEKIKEKAKTTLRILEKSTI
ncbi:8211_t:CDS:2 [Diversispora eburnea]|uniref:8211_t:CDS:1 n=1 Tax=Diversispora eburnea TaxID=1213867 RepID=A0A9N9BTP6_9GLOM|nr:8211_t:CDS:2 [Diversispora eburnea]